MFVIIFDVRTYQLINFYVSTHLLPNDTHGNNLPYINNILK